MRALDVLKAVDAVAAEDTRHTATLLTHFGISKKLIAVHQHNEQQSAKVLLERLQSGECIALVTDAGTPAISDPGAIVVDVLRESGVNVVPIPGPSAVITALSASGIKSNGFLFYGFLPSSGSQRRKILEKLIVQEFTLVFYEAPHRIVECISDMLQTFGESRRITIVRELTKTFETYHRSTLDEALIWLKNDSNQQRGEFVLMLEPDILQDLPPISSEAERTLKILLTDLPLKQAVKLTSEITSEKKNILYEFALKYKNE